MMLSGKQEKTILYIDDEQANLDGFLFNFRKDFQVYTATNTRDAFEIVSKNKIKVVLSDNRMPDMKGTEFFEILSVSHPDIIRILLTAYADTETILLAVNKGKIYRFITKPWSKRELHMSIENAFEAYDLKQHNNELFDDLTKKNEELEGLTFQLKIEVAERTKAQEELAEHKNNLEKIISDRTGQIEKINKNLAQVNKELVDANEIQNKINKELEDVNKKLYHEIEIRTQVQDMLAESENKFRGLIEQSSEGILLVDNTGKIIECNHALEVIMEKNKAEMLNTMLWDFDYESSMPENMQLERYNKIKNAIISFIDNIDNSKSFNLDGYRLIGGKPKYLSAIVFPVITPKGKFLGRIVRDFTERTKKDDELRLYKDNLEHIVKERTAQLNLSETRLRTLSDNLPGGAIYRGYTDLNGVDHLVYASARISQISGISYDSLIENISQFYSKIHPDDISQLIGARKRSQNMLDSLDLEIRYVRSSRVTLWIQLRTMFKKDEAGLIWWDGYVIDITKRKLAEKAAHESSEIIEKIQEGISSITGEKLFETVLLKLSETLKPELAYIGEISGENKDRIRTITVCSKGKITENMEYPIAGTPCYDVLFNNLSIIPFGVINRYPDNETYCILNVESFVGVPLCDTHGETIGIMVAAFTHPLNDTVFAEQILRIFSSRVGAEMERITAEAALKEREERFRTLFELSPNYKLISSVDGEILEANPAFIKMSGYRKSQILGASLLKLGLWSETEQKIVSKYLKSHGRFKNIEVKFKNRSFNIHYALMSVEPVILNGVTSLLTTATDITDRKLSEEAIQQYSDIAHNMQVALNVYGLNNLNDTTSLVLTKVNPAAERIIGKKSNEILGRSFYEIFPNLKDYGISEMLENVIKTGQSYENEEFRFYAENGKTYFFAVKAFKVPNNCVGILFEDITRRKNVEKSVKENEARYRALFDKSPNGIHLVGTNGDKAGRIISVNPMVQEMLGYSIAEIVGMPIDLVMQDIPQEDKSMQVNKLMSGATITFETVFFRKDKSSFPVEVTASIISLADQLFILGIDRDISERKHSEQLVKESEQKLLNIFNSSSDGIIITDFELNILAINDSIIKMMGYDGVDYSDVNPMQLILPEYHDMVNNCIQKLTKGEKMPALDVEVMHRSGGVIPVEVNSKIIIHDGKPSLLNILRDTTERKSMEKKLFETIIYTEEKERERFAGDLHDEVGPLLSSLKMYISLLSETEDKKKKEYIIPQIQTLIKESITTVREISNDLSPHVLNNYGCVTAINSFLSLKRDFLNIVFSQNLENNRYETNTEIVLYRIVKELVNNTIKHAKASRIDIKLFEEDSLIKLQYADNGIGFDINSTVGSSAGSIGLLNIMSRIKSVNGKYKINSSKGSGFDFELIISIGSFKK
jgi:PAS domain S-box-containing protein